MGQNCHEIKSCHLLLFELQSRIQHELRTVIAEIFIHDLISYNSYFTLNVQIFIPEPLGSENATVIHKLCKDLLK